MLYLLKRGYSKLNLNIFKNIEIGIIYAKYICYKILDIFLKILYFAYISNHKHAACLQTLLIL